MEAPFWLQIITPMLLVPAAVGALCAWLAGRVLGSRWVAAWGAAATGLAFFAAYGSFDWTSWKLDEFWFRLPWIIGAAATLEAALQAGGVGLTLGWPIRLVAAMGAACLLTPRGEGWEDLQPFFLRISCGFGAIGGLAWLAVSPSGNGASADARRQNDKQSGAVGRELGFLAVFLFTVVAAGTIAQSAGISKFAQLCFVLAAPSLGASPWILSVRRVGWNSAALGVAAVGVAGLMLLSFCETYSGIPWYCFAGPSIAQFLAGMGRRATSSWLAGGLFLAAAALSMGAAVAGHFLA